MPLLLSVAFQQLYQMADSMIVGRFAESAQAGELALAAVGASYPITQLFVAVATGINIGTSVLVSQLFGAKRYLRMKTAISTALITTTVVSLLLTLFGAVCGATLETADGQILDMMLQSSYETMDVGIAPKSTVVWRKQLEDGATLKLGADTVCEAWAYRVETY